MAGGYTGTHFYGWRVVYASFVLAFFGWGLGFFGPPVFLSVIREATGWSVALISAAVSVHFLVGAIVGANLPAFHRRAGAAAVTKAGALSMAAGLVGWSTASLAVAALRRRGIERHGLGNDERGGAQLDRLALVRARAPGGARDGLQRRERRRHRLLAVVGGRHRRAGISGGNGGDRYRHDPHAVGAVRSGVLAHTGDDGITARRRRARRARCPRDFSRGAAAARTAAVARSQIPHAVRRHGAGALRADRHDGASLFPARARARRATGRACDGLDHGSRDGHPDAAGFADVRRHRQAARGLRRLCRAARRIHRLHARCRHERSAVDRGRMSSSAPASATPPRCRRSSRRSSSSRTMFRAWPP